MCLISDAETHVRVLAERVSAVDSSVCVCVYVCGCGCGCGWVWVWVGVGVGVADVESSGGWVGGGWGVCE
jgi:hypothetical protein